MAPLTLLPLREAERGTVDVAPRAVFFREWIRERARAQRHQFVSADRYHERSYAELELHRGRPVAVIIVDPHNDVYHADIAIVHDSNWAARALLDGLAEVVIQVVLPPLDTSDFDKIRIIVFKAGWYDGRRVVVQEPYVFNDIQEVNRFLVDKDILFSVDGDAFSLVPRTRVEVLGWSFSYGYHFDAIHRTGAYLRRFHLLEKVWHGLPTRPFKVNVVESPGYVHPNYFSGQSIEEKNSQREWSELDFDDAPTSAWFKHFFEDIERLVDGVREPRPPFDFRPERSIESGA